MDDIKDELKLTTYADYAQTKEGKASAEKYFNLAQEGIKQFAEDAQIKNPRPPSPKMILIRKKEKT